MIMRGFVLNINEGKIQTFVLTLLILHNNHIFCYLDRKENYEHPFVGTEMVQMLFPKPFLLQPFALFHWLDMIASVPILLQVLLCNSSSLHRDVYFHQLIDKIFYTHFINEC